MASDSHRSVGKKVLIALAMVVTVAWVVALVATLVPTIF